MKTEKLIVVMDPELKTEFMTQCNDRMMTASAVVRRLVELQLKMWRDERTRPTKLKSH